LHASTEHQQGDRERAGADRKHFHRRVADNVLSAARAARAAPDLPADRSA
jgi:hypothetical protein